MILTCEKNKSSYEEKYNLFNKHNCDFIFISGNPDQEYEYIYDESKKILFIKCSDNYDNLPLKVFMGIKYIVQLGKYDGIFKLDDTSIVRRFAQLIDTVNKNLDKDYFGTIDQDNRNIPIYTLSKHRLGRFEFKDKYDGKKFNNSFFCHGCGYYISLKSCNIILNNFNIIKENVLEDTCIGLILNTNNIFPIRIDGFNYKLIHKLGYRKS